MKPPPPPPAAVEAEAPDAGAPEAPVDAGSAAVEDAPPSEPDAGDAPEGLEAEAVDAGLVLQKNGKPALFVWASASTEEEAKALLAEFQRMTAPWPELDGLTITPNFPRIIALGDEHLVVLGTCGPDTEAVVARPLSLVRLGRPSAELRVVDHPLGKASNCPRATGDVVLLPEVTVGKQTLAAAVVKRNRFSLTGPELNTTWDSLTLAVLRDQDGDGGVPGAVVDSALRDVRRCADPEAVEKKGTLLVTQRCVAADCTEAASVFYGTTTTSWSVKGKKLVSAAKTTRRPGRRCDRDDTVIDP